MNTLYGKPEVRVRDAIQLPISDNVVKNTTGICEATALTEREWGDRAGTENMGQIKAGHAAVTLDVVRVLNRAALDTEEPGATDVNGL